VGWEKTRLLIGEKWLSTPSYIRVISNLSTGLNSKLCTCIHTYAYRSTKRVSKLTEDWWSSMFHLSNAWARARACPFAQPSWMTGRSHGGRFWKENVLWKKKCFSWMNEACYYFCNCIPLFRMYFERHFDNVFCLQLNFEAKRERACWVKSIHIHIACFCSWSL